MAVKEAHHAEQNGGDQAFRGKALQVIVAPLNHVFFRGEDARQQVALEQHQHEHNAPDDHAYGNAVAQCLPGTLLVACAHVLGYKGGHGLHQSTGYQHGKVNDFAGHTVAGGGFQA